MQETKELQNLAINTIRFLSADAIQQANSGHPGLPMGTAPMAYTVWTRHLRHNPANLTWANRDRFGVREHGMGAVVNGLAYHGGFIPFGATFLEIDRFGASAPAATIFRGLGLAADNVERMALELL